MLETRFLGDKCVFSLHIFVAGAVDVRDTCDGMQDKKLGKRRQNLVQKSVCWRLVCVELAYHEMVV